jgi:hypothetical protein
MARLPDLPPSNLDPTPLEIRIRDKWIPFASDNHPGWQPFRLRLERRHGSYASVQQHLDGLPDELRSHLVGITLDELINLPDGNLSDAAQNHLNSLMGRLDITVEGICLANPNEDRAHVRKQIGSLNMDEVRSIGIRPA